MIDLLGTDPRKRLPGCTLELLCDVDAPYIGPRGAARVFAPQKGAGPAEVELLEQKMVQMAAKLNTAFGVDVAEVPGAGAAGGLAGALMATLGARIVPGISRILDLVRFQEAIRDADLIFTGEGKSDSQTLMGKVPYGVLQKACGIPVALVSGRIEDVEALSQAGFGPIVEVSPRNLPLLQVLDPVVATDNIPKAIYNVHF